ncbi:MAG: S8 family serine peptidase [Ottowia sp.]|nr:S8 family serine peptidase [Ottowia sp.]
MTKPTSHDITQAALKETFVLWASKALNQDREAIRQIAEAIFTPATTTHAYADLLEAHRTHVNEMTTQVLAELQSVDTSKLNVEMQTRHAILKNALNEANRFFQAAKEAETRGDNLNRIGSLDTSVEVFTTLKKLDSNHDNRSDNKDSALISANVSIDTHPNSHLFTSGINSADFKTQKSALENTSFAEQPTVIIPPTSIYIADIPLPGNDHSPLGETIDLAQKNVLNAAGNSGDDILIGDAHNNWLSGGLGSDTFYAGGGDDVLIIDAEDLPQNIHGGTGTDTVQGVGDKGIYLDLAQAEIEIAQGGRGDDIFIGGSSRVFIRGGGGNDKLSGGTANDVLGGENGNDLLDGGAGNDVLHGHRGLDTLLGEAGDDLLDGGMDDDILNGGTGNDIFIGGAGDDRIDGGEGIDVIELSGSYTEYRIFKIAQGIWISDTVAGRDGTDFVRNVERANFKDIGRVEIPSNTQEGLANPFVVKDVLSKDKNGIAFSRTTAHLISQAQLLANDIDWQGDALTVTELFDSIGGQASLTESGDILFTPHAQHTGFMGFNYTLRDSKGNLAATIIESSKDQNTPMRASVMLKTADLSNDPLLTEQWYLADTNILPVWKHYTGKGIRIGQFEPSRTFSTGKEILNYRHADLKDNIDQQWLANTTPGQGPSGNDQFSPHATMVADIMVAARNGQGRVGVAYHARMGGHWINANDFSTLAYMRHYDVVNHSWTGNQHFGLRFTPATLNTFPNAYSEALNDGRRGLGTVIVTAGGNDRATGNNTNYQNQVNTRATLVVGAIPSERDLSALQLGQPPFSNPGANILISAPGDHVVSNAYLAHSDNGTTVGVHHADMKGTSFAAPIISGIVALMLEANPDLGYRDIQAILALCAKKINDANTTWQTNGSTTWNGGGMHVSHDYGYGKVDAQAAVRLAQNWVGIAQTEHNVHALTTPLTSGDVHLAIPDGEVNGLRHTLAMGPLNVAIEYTEVKLSLTHARPGDLVIRLIAPSGTQSVLLNRPGKAPGSNASVRGDTSFSGTQQLDYVFSTALLRGEKAFASSNWTLHIIDTFSGDTGILHNWSMNVYGAKYNQDDHYVYTDEYAQLAASGRNILNDSNDGNDTINAAAIHRVSHIDLSNGQATLAGTALTIQNPHKIENLVGGDFDDTLTGNAQRNVLVSGHGNDTLSGGSGMDILFGGLGNNTLIGGADSDFFIIENNNGATDTIQDFVLDTDRVVFSGFADNIIRTLRITQEGADTRLRFGDNQSVLLKNILTTHFSAINTLTIAKGIHARDVIAAHNFGLGSDGSPTDGGLPNVGVTMWLGVGNDKIFGGQGNDTIHGGSGDDLIVGESSTDDLIGNDDTLYGDAGEDHVRGGPGNDILYGGDDLDVLGGDAGDDVIYLEGDEALDGSKYDHLTILKPSITLDDYTIFAHVWGGAGDDRFVLVEDRTEAASHGLMKNLITDFEINNPEEKIDLSSIRAISALSDLRFTPIQVNDKHYLRIWLGPMAIGTQYLTLEGITATQLSSDNFIFAPPNTFLPQTKAHIEGTYFSDYLLGDAGGNTLDGKTGADTLEGRLGDDTYIVDHIGDVIKELPDGGIDTVKSSITYTLPNELEHLTLTGTAHINGTGNALDNRIVGNAGNNILDGKNGTDNMIGGAGNDTYIVDNNADHVIEQENEGIDTVHTYVSYTLGQYVENLTLMGNENSAGTGNTLNNHLLGNAGKNRLIAWDGDDILDGGADNDVLVGGQGNDIYRFARDGASDLIFEDDVTPNNSDTLEIGENITSEQLWFARDGDNLTVSIIGTKDRAIISNHYGGSNTKSSNLKPLMAKPYMSTKFKR